MMAIVLLQSGMRKQYTKIMRLHLCILAGRNGWTGRLLWKTPTNCLGHSGEAVLKGCPEMLGCCSEIGDQENVIALRRASQ